MRPPRPGVLCVCALALAGTLRADQTALDLLKKSGGAPDATVPTPASRPAAAADSCGGGIGAACRRVAELFDPTAYPYPDAPGAASREEARILAAARGAEAALPPASRGVLDDLRALGVSETDLYHGSHVVIPDGGLRYARWRALDAAPRISSHYPDVHVQQYELRLHGIGVLLFGRTGDGSTWCQMEAHGADPQDALLHVGDYLKHEIEGGQNVGPMGMSPRTESRPLVAAPAAASAPKGV